MMVIIGIDPGLQITGYGILAAVGTEVRVLEAGVIRTNGKDTLENKLSEIFKETGEIIDQYHPEYVAIEELYSHYAHPKTAIIMAHARGIVFLQAARNNIPVVSYASTRIKKSLTGNGRASKAQMQRMIKTALNLKKDVFSADTADALAVALCHHNVLMGK
jgi:crossover junction endodeoxyribonuclease RuvC